MRRLLVLGLLACSDGRAEGGPSPGGQVRLEEVASGLSSPVHLTAPAGDARLFVVEQPGRIRIVQGGRLLPTPFLDLTDRVRSGGERGLLSLAFHPRYADNGLLFVNYTDRDGDTRIERYRVRASDPNRADPASAKLLLRVEQPYSNHNGGQIAFGPDGKLYVGMGDGGSGGDPQGHGQNPRTLLGAMLRLDVDAGDPYAVPRDNPFVGNPRAREEIWATGVRNPWRFSFDGRTGLLYVADVGQNRWEEVNVVEAAKGGLNYGWNRMEAAHCFSSERCDRSGLVLPALEYDHSEGCTVIGGYVYRGSRIPALQGHYFYADYCQRWVRSFRYTGGAAADRREWDFGEVGSILSFGEDAAGELYVLSDGGKVYRMVPGR